VVLAGCALLVHRGPRRLGPWQHAIGALLGAVASFTVFRPTGAPLPTFLGGRHALGLVAGLLVAGIVAALVLVVVEVVRRHRLRLLAYVSAVAVWTALVLLVQRLAGGWSLLNLDLAFAACLLVAWTTWRWRLQHAVDGFEVVVAAVVTSTVLDTTVLLDTLGVRFSVGLLAITLAIPGLVVCVRLWIDSEASGRAVRRREVGRACTVYGLLLALVSLTGSSAATTLDAFGGLVVHLLTLPLALLLVAATSAGRLPAGSTVNPVPPPARRA
jgi:hypothetical protein